MSTKSKAVVFLTTVLKVVLRKVPLLQQILNSLLMCWWTEFWQQQRRSCNYWQDIKV